MIEVPKILDFSEKLMPLIYEINNYSYFLIEGGRGGGKSQTVARLILWIAEQKKVRVCCGRETQNTIEESVYKIFKDIILDNELNFIIQKGKIIHKTTGSEIIFKGFKENGRVNIKGLEGIDILWIDEAQAITKATLDIIVPTIRKKNSVVYFTMNRNVRQDAIYVEFAKDPDCLHIKVNYYDNKYCPKNLIDKAERCKERNKVDYDHIWEGNPKDSSSDFLVSSKRIEDSKEVIFPKENYSKIKCLGVDLSGQGGDLCVATLVENVSSQHFRVSKRESWNDPDTDNTKGKIMSLYTKWQPNILILDADGLGYPIYVSVKKMVKNAIAFHGAGASRKQNALNQRADGYLTLKEFIENGWLEIPQEDTRCQLELIKREYAPNGTVKIQKKSDMKQEIGESPDYADSLMMAIYGLNYYSYMIDNDIDEVQVVMDTSYEPFD